MSKAKIFIIIIICFSILSVAYLKIRKEIRNMASIKISELNETTTPQDNDLIPIVDVIGNETKKTTKGNLINDVYSTSEVKTNKRWIDGKPIYRQVVITGDLGDANRWDYDGLYVENRIQNAYDIVSVNAYASQDPNYSYITNISSYSWWANSQLNTINVNASAFGINFISKTNTIPVNDPELKYSYVIIEYTKS